MNDISNTNSGNNTFSMMGGKSGVSVNDIKSIWNIITTIDIYGVNMMKGWW